MTRRSPPGALLPGDTGLDSQAVLAAGALMAQVPDWRAALPRLLAALAEGGGVASAWALEQRPEPGSGWHVVAAHNPVTGSRRTWDAADRAVLAAQAIAFAGSKQLCFLRSPTALPSRTGTVLIASFGVTGMTTGALVLSADDGIQAFPDEFVHLVTLGADAVSERIRQERLALGLAVGDRALAAIARAGESLLASASWCDAVPEFLAHVAAATAASRAYLISRDSAGVERLEHEWRAEGISASVWEEWDAVKLRDGLAVALNSGRAYQVVASRVSNRGRQLFEREGTKSLACVAVPVDAVPRFRLGVDDCSRERSWGAIELEALQIGARMLATAIERGRQDDAQRHVAEALHVRERILAGVAQGSQLLLREPQPDDRSFDEALAAIGVAAGALGACLAVPDSEESTSLLRIASWDAAKPRLRRHPVVGEPLTLSKGAVVRLRAGELITVEEPAEDVARTVVPILADGSLRAAFSIVSRLGREWTSGEEAALRAAAAMFGATMARRDAEARLRGRELQLIETQKLEAVGRLASVVAHDFNNVLTTVGGFAEVLRDEVEGEVAHSYLNSITRASEEAIGLTRQLLSFARPGESTPLSMDLATVLQELSPLLRGAAGRLNVLVLAAASARVVLDRTELQQVALNLVANARDAIGDTGGVVTVECGCVDETTSFLAVSDTGCGIAEDVRERLFEPFFTTKGAGLGTGLGLATVSRIVLAAGGRIGVESTPGAGSRFLVSLPSDRSESTQPLSPP